MSATVLEPEKKAYGIYKLDDGQQIIVTCPLTDSEMAAYRRYPETFFDVPERKGGEVRDLLDAFDSLYETYRHTPKEKLLEFMRNWPTNIEALKQKGQEELAIDYCEAMAHAMMNPRRNPRRCADEDLRELR